MLTVPKNFINCYRNSLFRRKENMKPLEKGRQVLTWIGINFVDEVAPTTSGGKCARKISPVLFRSVCIAIFVVHVITLMKVRFTDAEEYFYTLIQFVFIIHGSSSFFTLVACSRISLMFQGLTEIYEKCKPREYFTL